MSNADLKETENELSDVLMCYKAFGLSVSDSPEQIESMYKMLMEECRKNLSAPDPSVRLGARNDLTSIKNMYDTIKGSISYRSVARQSGNAVKVTTVRNGNRISADADVVLNYKTVKCPSCNNLIRKSLKTCPVCNARIYTKTEQLVNFAGKFITKKKVFLLSVFLILAIIAALVLMYPEIVIKNWSAVFSYYHGK
jgi:rubrerythrin